MTTEVGEEIGWFFGDECDPCTGSLPSVDGTLGYGHVSRSPGGTPFSISIGVAGLFLPYVEGYVQLSRSSSLPYGVGARLGALGSWRQAHLFGRVDKRLSPRRRFLWNPSVFYHEGDRNSQNQGRIVALVNGFGLEVSSGPVAFTPSVSVVAANARHSGPFRPATPETRVFGAASLGIAFRRDPYR
jgi:hypothetical protein